MNEAHGPLDRLEARLEQLTARVDDLSRLVERGPATEPARPTAHEHARRKRRRHPGRPSRVH